MKGKLFKKALAVATSVLMLAGGAMVQPFAGICRDITVTASAADASALFGTPVNGLYTLETKTYTLTEDIYTEGRIYVPQGIKAIIDLNGHTIDRGLDSFTDGGSVFGVAGGGKLTVENGTIKGGRRSSGNGGGFNVNGELILNGVTIEDCKAEHAGGGIYINGENASVNMTGHCIVSNNTAGTYGGGIYVGQNARLTIEGKPVVKGNSETNVYLVEGKKINFSGTLTSGAEVGVTYADEGKGSFTNGYTTAGNTVKPSAYFFGDNGNTAVLNGNEASLAIEYVNRSWDSEAKEIKEETRYVDRYIPFGEVKVSGNSTVDLTGDQENQWYVLTEDTHLTHKVRVFGDVNFLLCDGKELTCDDGVVVENNNRLNIYGQTANTGKLDSKAYDNNAAIGGDKDGSSDDKVGTIRIFGGDIVAKGGKYGAGIGGIAERGESGTIEIYGGTVNAKARDSAAGIGGGAKHSAGNIRIYGGLVGAEGGDGAPGIGSGRICDTVGNIEIFGGKVIAKGGPGGTGGPGIGGGADEDIESGSITISGGDVEAYGARCSSGIGSAWKTDAKMDITITGGRVIAQPTPTGRVPGAGIGSGGSGDFTGTITITGGTVTATGDGYEYDLIAGSAGIGAGDEGDMSGTITITGGDVTAVGACGGAAIGAGKHIAVWGGGNCTGKVSITGGTVKLSSKSNENTPCVFIGRGYEGESDGALELGGSMKAKFRNSDDTFTDIREDELFTACRSTHTGDKYLCLFSDDTGSIEEFDDEEEDDIRPYGCSLSLEGDIGVNFYMYLPTAVINDNTTHMHFTLPDGTTKDVYLNDSKYCRTESIRGKIYYVFKCNVSAKDMASEFTAQMFDGSKTCELYTYSVKEYADYLLSHTQSNAEYAKAAPLVKKMLNYGAASQTYFGIEGTPANDGLDDADKALGNVSIPNTFKYTDNATLPEGVTFEGATLSLKSETTLSLYFTGLPDDTEFTCSGKTVETAKIGKYVVARIRGINASELKNYFTVTFTGGSVTYNAMTYCYNVLNGASDDENLKNVCRALFLYAEAAHSYLGYEENNYE